MKILPISTSNSFGAKIEMSPNYMSRLYGRSGQYFTREENKKSVDAALKRISDSPIQDTYRLENTFDRESQIVRGLPRTKRITTLNIVYKNGEKLGVFPGRENRFIKKLSRSLDLQDKYPYAFQRLGMEDRDIIRMCNELSKAGDLELEQALEKIENSSTKKEYRYSSERLGSSIYADYKNILKNEKGRVIKRKTCPAADFIVSTAKKYFK